MIKDEFAKLFRYIEEFRSDVDRRFKEVWKRFDKVDQRFDEQSKMILDNQSEILAVSNKTDRLEHKLL